MADLAGLNLEPRSYDSHGCPHYDRDLLDLRWGDFIDREIPEAREDLRIPLEASIGDLLYTDNVDLIRRFVELVGLLAERHIQRLAHPNLLDEQSGQARHRAGVVADLRAKLDEYDRVRVRAGWPEDPADLDDKQLDQASVVVLNPELLRNVFEEPPEA